MDGVILSEQINTIVSENEATAIIREAEKTIEVVEVELNKSIVSQETTTLIISEGTQGPPGVSGIAEEDMPYSKRIDFITDNLLYRGEANVGSLTAEPVWRIRKIEIGPDGDISETWANGDASFSNVWDSRLLASYS